MCFVDLKGTEETKCIWKDTKKLQDFFFTFCKTNKRIVTCEGKWSLWVFKLCKRGDLDFFAPFSRSASLKSTVQLLTSCGTALSLSFILASETRQSFQRFCRRHRFLHKNVLCNKRGYAPASSRCQPRSLTNKRSGIKETAARQHEEGRGKLTSCYSNVGGRGAKDLMAVALVMGKMLTFFVLV